MANIYLEKIAGILGSPARLAVRGAKYIGNQAKLALGVGERDYITKTLNLKNPKVVMDHADALKNYTKGKSFGTKRQLLKAKVKEQLSSGPTKDTYQETLRKAKVNLKTDAKGLQNQKTDARIILGGTAIGGIALKNKLTKPEEQQTYYNY